ncbi:hypothetical protein [Nocardia jiangxiensis]|uniref:hypothetical protein n=1 Tax=Nocardia jiangxiensis TaxID=282685 RepID=UPI0002EC857E|nr:hypothetical protein [Nocardia jiangxiensis]
MKCAVCLKLDESVYCMKLYTSDFEVLDAVTTADGHAVCDDHLWCFEEKVSDIASKLSRIAGERYQARKNKL